MHIIEKITWSCILAVLFLGLTITYRPLFVSNTPESKIVELHITRQSENFSVNESSPKAGIAKLPLAASRAICSGAFVTDDGLILTARHCTEGAQSIEVITADHQHYSGFVLAKSPRHDLAVIQIGKRHTPFFKLASTTRRGETVFALGSPLGITDTLSTGIVAKLDGDVTLIDCSALPGNSGCPLFNKKGELVGVVIAGFWVGFGTTHLNLAQSLDAVKFFLGELR